MENSKLKYILPLLAILLSLTIMQIFCNGADNSSYISFYDFQPQIINIDYEFIKQEKNNSVDYDLQFQSQPQIQPVKKTSSYSVNKPGKNTKQRPGIFRRR